jgi:aryl-alcohol dehydrogenase-like predicted oxidoreductase
MTARAALVEGMGNTGLMTDVRYRPLGDSGLAVSVVGLGCNNFGRRIGRERAGDVVGAALDAGITLFDTSDTYGDPRGASEEMLGEALTGRRGEAVIATKFGSDMGGANGPDWGRRGSRRYVRIAVEASLRRLGTDWIDLYQLHRPDPGTPIEETLSALDDLVREGKVRYVGCSNFSGWQVADADWTARTHGYSRFVSAQNEYSLLNGAAGAELLPACRRFGLGLLPFFPLANGLLTGKYRRGSAPPEGSRLADPYWKRFQRAEDAPWDVLERLEMFARERGHSLLDLAFSGLAAQPGVASVIAGATSADQVRANAAAAAWRLRDEDLAELDRITGA